MSAASRRSVLKALVFFVAAICAPGLRATEVGDADATYGDPGAADRWMTEWQNIKRRSASGMLTLARFADPIYIITKPITWTPNPPQEAMYHAVTVPAGFVTDFASIPRIFWSMLRPDGDYSYAAIIHDYLYWEQPVPRETADEILRFAMEDFKVNPNTVKIIYTAVRLGGASAWNSNAKLKEAGEKRVLKRFPEDPTTRWADWKRRADVF